MWRRTSSTSSARRTNESATMSTPISSPKRSSSRSSLGTEGSPASDPGTLRPWREVTAAPSSTSVSTSQPSLTAFTRSRTEPSAR